MDHATSNHEADAAKSSSPTSPTAAPTVCSACGLAMEGQFVRALGGCYHLNCFKCLDCGDVVAARFFPLEVKTAANTGPATTIHPLCERDYFRRLDLLCAKCGSALRGSYITAIGKKYHLDHFTCSLCPTVFGPDETYYEHEGKIFCHFHYSVHNAVPCGGCKMPILKQFVEVKGEEREQWHPECYMIFKSWNVKMAVTEPPPPQLPEEAKLQQGVVEEKVNRIWNVLSAFEESAAACISDMLLHVSNLSYIDAVGEAGNFIMHVDVLFAGIDDLEARMTKYTDSIGLAYNKEPKMLAKKIVNFFSLLSHTQDSRANQQGTVTQELLSLVTSLAQYLKVLIRIALAGALKLERLYGEKTAVGDFLNKLIELGKDEDDGSGAAVPADIRKFDQRYHIADIYVKSDLCMVCRNSVEEACIRFNASRWHKKCFTCYVTRMDLVPLVKEATYDEVEGRVYGPNRGPAWCKTGFQPVTQLQEYTFLLRVALKRLYSLLKVKDDSSAPVAGLMEKQASVGSAGLQVREDESQRDLGRQGSGSVALPLPGSAAARDVPIRDLDDGHPQSKRALNSAAPHSQSMHTIIEDMHGSSINNTTTDNHSMSAPVTIDQKFTSAGRTTNLSTSLPESNSVAAANRTKQEDALNWPMSPIVTDASTNSVDDASMRQMRTQLTHTQQPRILFFAELSALEYFIVRHAAVLRMQPLVADYYTTSELLDVIRNRKASFWHKLFSSFKGGKKPKDGVFGVPLDVLIEKSGIDSKHGTGFGRIRIPSFVDISITALKSMDLRVEGIFRKNGNIKNLKVLEENIDRDAWFDLKNENPIQVAALLKKFLREMPEPLLTFKLYKLFILSQRLPNPDARKRMLHYIVCLLPKQNRDTLEVLLAFLREVASFSGGETGNKMDVNNLATVIAPNILYNKQKDSGVSGGGSALSSSTAARERNNLKDESLHAISVLCTLIQNQDEMWKVPPEIADLVSNDLLGQDTQATDLSSKDLMKLISMKKAHSFRDIHIDGRETAHPTAASATVEENWDTGAVLGPGALTGPGGRK